MERKTPILKLLRRNILALISLTLAVASLSYNTWRNDATELNRNQRAAGFAALKELASLQLLVDHITYGSERDKGDPIAGWTHVIFIGDLSHLTSAALEAEAAKLKDSWSEHVGQLSEEAANKAISQRIEAMRQETLRAPAHRR